MNTTHWNALAARVSTVTIVNQQCPQFIGLYLMLKVTTISIYHHSMIELLNSIKSIIIKINGKFALAARLSRMKVTSEVPIR